MLDKDRFESYAKLNLAMQSTMLTYSNKIALLNQAYDSKIIDDEDYKTLQSRAYLVYNEYEKDNFLDYLNLKLFSDERLKMNKVIFLGDLLNKKLDLLKERMIDYENKVKIEAQIELIDSLFDEIIEGKYDNI